MLTQYTGTVVEGKRLGRELGFPTANIAPDDGANLPADGVYAARILLPNEADWRLCVLNQGKHPTVPGGPPTIEAHIIDFEGDIYGARVTLGYLKFLRAERKFDSIDALVAQLRLDVEAARGINADAVIHL